MILWIIVDGQFGFRRNLLKTDSLSCILQIMEEIGAEYIIIISKTVLFESQSSLEYSARFAIRFSHLWITKQFF
jgi:hypothetical protein